MKTSHIKLETYIPESHLKSLQHALQEVDAGHIGNYDSCMSHYAVTGIWRALDGANPHVGKVGGISEEPEIKIEVTLRVEQAKEVVAAVRQVHPYEEPKVAEYYMGFLSPTLDYNQGAMGKIPTIIDEEEMIGIVKISEEEETLSKEDWDSYEISWDFKKHPLV